MLIRIQGMQGGVWLCIPSKLPGNKDSAGPWDILVPGVARLLLVNKYQCPTTGTKNGRHITGSKIIKLKADFHLLIIVFIAFQNKEYGNYGSLYTISAHMVAVTSHHIV